MTIGDKWTRIKRAGRGNNTVRVIGFDAGEVVVKFICFEGRYLVLCLSYLESKFKRVVEVVE